VSDTQPSATDVDRSGDDPARHDPVRPGQVAPSNRWDELAVPDLGTWTPTRRVSVVLPYYEAPAELEITLAALARQTYPRELTQFIVADDGSSPPLTLPEGHRGLDITVVHQEDRGFGLARVRNLGASVADGDVLVFLDCDMVPEPEHLEAHARWHHVCDHALTLGFRQHVEFDGIGPDEVDAAAASGGLGGLFEGRSRREPAWLVEHLARMDELRGEDDDLFRAVTGGNLGIRAATFASVGGFDASFTQWGCEDTDLGHRCFLAGALLVPERAAACWHQGDSGGLEPHERASLVEQRARLAQTVPQRGFRRIGRGRSFRIPQLVVEVTVGTEPHATITGTLESVMASELHDLEIVLTLPEDHPDHRRLEREWAGDPRVVDRLRDDHAWSPYRLQLPVGARLHPRTLDAIVWRFIDRKDRLGVLRLTVPDRPPSETHALAVSTRAIGRARLATGDIQAAGTPPVTGDALTETLQAAGELFGQHWSSGADVGLSWAPVEELERLRTWRPKDAAVWPPDAGDASGAGRAAAASGGRRTDPAERRPRSSSGSRSSGSSGTAATTEVEQGPVGASAGAPTAGGTAGEPDASTTAAVGLGPRLRRRLRRHLPDPVVRVLRRLLRRLG
jgi:GT2 family glycosyltransferase